MTSLLVFHQSNVIWNTFILMCVARLEQILWTAYPFWRYKTNTMWVWNIRQVWITASTPMLLSWIDDNFIFNCFFSCHKNGLNLEFETFNYLFRFPDIRLLTFNPWILMAWWVLTIFFMCCATCIGNHMISSAIWNKLARVNFLKTNKIARARRASAICGLWKN